jgi:hypothetical protein
MQSLPVIEHFYVFPDTPVHFIPGYGWFSIYPLDFKAMEEAFRNCIIQAFTFATHAA